MILPSDTLGIIFSYCDYFTQQKVKLASKKWHRYITKLDAENQMIFVLQIIQDLAPFGSTKALRLKSHIDPDPVHRIAQLRRAAILELKVRCLGESSNTPSNCFYWLAQHWNMPLSSDPKTIDLYCSATNLKNIEEMAITSIRQCILERPCFPFFSKMIKVLAHLPTLKHIRIGGQLDPHTLLPEQIAFDSKALIELLRTRPLVSFSFSFMHFNQETLAAIMEHVSNHNGPLLAFKSCTLPICPGLINSASITIETSFLKKTE